MPYATVEDFMATAAVYGVALPEDPQAVLDAGQRDTTRYLGAAYDPAVLLPSQAEALRDASCIQACFRVEMSADMLGAEDGLASAHGVTFSIRPRPRFSPEAAERLAGHGLYRRSGLLGST